jgi:hypothetical protein
MWFNSMGAVVYQAVGSAFAGKRYKEIFQITDEKSKVKQGSKTEREEMIDYFKKQGLLRSKEG